eukprot:UC4_evm1s744
MKASGDLKQYMVYGRHYPTEKKPNPPIFKMELFAPTKVHARSRFWYFLAKLKKVKRANGEVLRVDEVFEKKPTSIKNFGIE